MSTRHNHSNPYSASDIEKYLKGELPAREMHDLEQAALEDPFLADALEGLALHPGLPQNPRSTLAEDLSDLHQRLSTHVAEKTRHTPIRTIRRRIAIAAICLLLLGIGFTFYYTAAVHKRSPITDIADNQRPARAAAPAPADSTSIASAAANPKSREAAPTPQADSTALATRQATTPRETALARTSPAQANKARAKTAAAPTADADVAITPPAALPPATRPPAGATPAPTLPGLRIETDSIQYNFKAFRQPKTLNNDYLSAADHPLVYSGKVLDAQNHPIAGAFLSLGGLTNIHTITDQQGMFNISLRPQDSTRLLNIARIGYNQASLALNTLSTDRQAGNVIYLQPHPTNLDEVVVAGYGAARKEIRAGIPSDKNEKLDILWQKASPNVGREAYLLYLAAAKSKLGLDSTITGVETISFEVDRNGVLSAFKIEQSLSPAHDAGVIRLINDGPSWGLLKGKSKKVRAAVSVIF